MLSKSCKYHKYKRLYLYIIKNSKDEKYKNCTFDKYVFMIIESSKMVKIHFVCFTFLDIVKDGKIQNTKDVFLLKYKILLLVFTYLVKYKNMYWETIFIKQATGKKA